MKYLLLFSLCISILSLHAQQITTEITWEKTYGGAEGDIPLKSRKTSDGGQIIVGHTQSGDGDFSINKGQKDAFILKLDSEGNIAWKETLGGSSDEHFSDVQQTPDGGYIVVGETYSSDGDILYNYGYVDSWLIRFDSDGNILWSKVLGGSSFEKFYGLEVTADGEYLIAGFSYSTDGDFANIPDKTLDDPFALMLFDREGEFKTWYPLPTSCSELVLTNNNVAWGLGYRSLIRVDLTTKAVRMIDFLDLGEKMVFSSIQKAESGNLLIGGHEFQDNQFASSPRDAILLKVDPTGLLIWKKKWSSNNINTIKSIDVTPNGDYLVGGHTNSTNNLVQTKYGYQDCWIFTTNTSGELKHQAFYGSYSNDFVHDIQAASDSVFFFIGRTMISSNDVSQHKGKSDIWVVKLKANFIRQAPDKEILVYPNPIFNRQFTLEINPEFIGASFSIYNNLGQVIQTGTIYSSINFLQLANAQTDGMYTLLVQQGKTILNQKLLLHR